MELTNKFLKKIAFLFLLFPFWGCSQKVNPLDYLKGEWITKDYQIAPISNWYDIEAKKLIGGRLDYSETSIKFLYSGKKCEMNLKSAKYNHRSVKEEMYFKAGEKGTFDLAKWGLNMDQDVIDIDLNSDGCPFYVIVYFKKDKKLIAMGDGGAFLLERKGE